MWNLGLHIIGGNKMAMFSLLSIILSKKVSFKEILKNSRKSQYYTTWGVQILMENNSSYIESETSPYEKENTDASTEITWTSELLDNSFKT